LAAAFFIVAAMEENFEHTPQNQQKNILRIVIIAAVALAVVGGVAWWLGQATTQTEVQTGEAQVGGPINMIDHKGNIFTEKDLQGKYALIFFGFTNCPDTCPMRLQDITQVLEILGPDAEKIRPVLITTDPARDTPAQLADYLSNFHPAFIGLTGSQEQVDATLAAYKVYASKVPEAQEPDQAAHEHDDNDHYQMDHSSFTYLMGPDGKFVKVFAQDVSAEQMAAELKEIVK
jgi:protein SCO1/2